LTSPTWDGQQHFKTRKLQQTVQDNIEKASTDFGKPLENLEKQALKSASKDKVA